MDLARNPFFVLELDPRCSRVEVERAGQKLLAMLEVGFAEVASYRTPLGQRSRTSEDVREAMATLRDPDKRLLAELWANAPTHSIGSVDSKVGSGSTDPGSTDSDSAKLETDDQAGRDQLEGFPSALAALGLQ